jgi:hypothetical protein
VDVKRKKDMPADDGGCRRFKLTKADVLEFFKISYPSSEVINGNEAFETFRNPYCIESGQAVLQSGQKVIWYITKTRVGSMYFPDGSRSLHFYCKNCPTSSRKYNEECDIECYNKRLSE